MIRWKFKRELKRVDVCINRTFFFFKKLFVFSFYIIFSVCLLFFHSLRSSLVVNRMKSEQNKSSKKYRISFRGIESKSTEEILEHRRHDFDDIADYDVYFRMKWNDKKNLNSIHRLSWAHLEMNCHLLARRSNCDREKINLLFLIFWIEESVNYNFHFHSYAQSNKYNLLFYCSTHNSLIIIIFIDSHFHSTLIYLSSTVDNLESVKLFSLFCFVFIHSLITHILYCVLWWWSYFYHSKHINFFLI